MLFCHIVSRTSVFLAALCAVAVLRAQEPPPMSLVQLAELPRMLEPQLSPDGRSVAYMLGTADWTAGRLVYHLWRQDAGSAAVALTSGTPPDNPGSTRWSPDGASILFNRGGQLWLIPKAGGTPKQITKHVTGVGSATWSPDGRTIYFTAVDPQTPEERERERRRDDLTPFEENLKVRQLWSIDVASGAEKQLTAGNLYTASYRLSPDGTRVVVERAKSPLANDEHTGELWVMRADGSDARQITRDDVQNLQGQLSPDNSQVLFLATASEKLVPYYNTHLFIVSAAGGTPRPAAPGFPYAIDQAAWTPDGASILAVANMGVHSEIFRIDVASRTATQLTEGRHYITPGSFAVVPSAGRMLMQLDEPERYGDAWTMPISASEGPSRVTSLFDGFTQKYAVPRQEKVTWKSNGTTIEGVLMYPRNYRPGTRYPLVVQLHGGPAESDKFGAGPGLLLNYFPVLTGQGWFVLRPNYRGSTGYGDAFLRDIIPGYFRNMQYDVLSGVDELIKQGLVDGDRMVLMGWSAGGHLTNKLVTMTTRFKAASSGASVSNWVSMFSQTDDRDTREPVFGGTPWQKNTPIMLWWNASPLKDAANVKTPILLFSGDVDPRVPKEQSIEWYRALKSHGVPTHLYNAPREQHLWGELRHQIAKGNAELAWFAEYALHTSYTPEQAPGLP